MPDFRDHRMAAIALAIGDNSPSRRDDGRAA
jgi:hypothetical protein